MLDQTGTRHSQSQLDIGRDLAALEHAGSSTQIFDPRIGARSDEHLVDLDFLDRHVGVQPHVLERPLDTLATAGILLGSRIGHLVADRHHHLGRGAPRHLWQDVLGTHFKLAIELGAFVAAQGTPDCRGSLPLIGLGRKLTALQIFDRHFVNTDKAHACACFNRHVAQGHPCFHRQTADRAAAKLDGIARTAGRPDASDDRQRDILGRHALTQLTFDANQHRLRLLLHQTLCCQHMLNFGSTDAHGHAAESPVRAGMRIAAHDGHAGQDGTIFWANHVNNALTQILEREISQRTRFTDVRVERLDLLARHRVFDPALPEVGRRIVIRRRHDRCIAPRLAPGQSQPLKGLWTRHFVHQMTIDVNQRSTIGFFLHHMALPKFVIQILRHISATPKKQAPVGQSELNIISRLLPAVSLIDNADAFFTHPAKNKNPPNQGIDRT